ncbi:MAG TPA: 3-dehydroquinate synthase [Candidatus Butyricicoccus stercorigallinarum]|nr:3-dehydroquinate synthase [Candidatus Butyricicoccus stercorigallinarum]
MYHLTLHGSASTSDIYIGAGVFQQTAKRVAEKFKPTHIHVVTDSNVAPLYLRELCAEFPLNITTSVIPAGEEHKTLETVAQLYADMSEAELTRSDLVIALGGGVVGDLTGFAAATYLRGIHVCQIPTTLLAQVDSSVGGKTGVDLPQGKNLVGAFYQPELVMIDTDILSSLPARIFNDGMAEVIKYGCISNPTILELIAQPDFRSNMEQIVYESVRIKRDVVQQDEHDNGLRMTLNFGHTIGHAAEKVGHFTELSHGQAVAIGMVQAAKLGAALGEADLTEQIAAACRAHDLPTELPYPVEEIYDALLRDKKRMADTMNFILVHPLGKAVIHKIPLEQLRQLILSL